MSPMGAPPASTTRARLLAPNNDSVFGVAFSVSAATAVISRAGMPMAARTIANYYGRNSAKQNHRKYATSNCQRNIGNGTTGGRGLPIKITVN